MLILAHGTPPSESAWTFDLHLDVMVVMATVALAYVWAIRRLGPRLAPAGEPPVTGRQGALLVTAIGLLWAFSIWPVHNLAEGFSYTVHMLQHSVYTLVVPPLLILGTPPWLWRWALRPVMPVFRVLVRPVTAVSVYSAVVVLTHLPPLADAAVRSGGAHVAQHAVLFVSAVVVWWPIASRVPELPRLSAPLQQMLYLFFVSLVPSMAGSSLIWSQAPLYRAYEPFPHLFGQTTLEDQQTGGVVMELVEGVVVWGLLLVVFLRMARAEARGEGLRGAQLWPRRRQVGAEPQ